MNARVAVIGGGWYGCHIASSLKALEFKVTLFEQHARLLNEASGNNQFRLHLGFHYARHHGTRVQSRDGYMRFMERYSQLSREVAKNIYAVPTEDSLIDWQTYKLIMTSTGLNYREIDPGEAALTGMSGVMMVEERVLLIEQARRYFTEILGSCLQLGTRIQSIKESPSHVILNGEAFDYVVDATWGHLTKIPVNLYFEPTILLYYEGKKGNAAVTMVDGPLCSVYPTEDETLYTLSSVPHTPLNRYTKSAEARFEVSRVNSETVNMKRLLMEKQIRQYMPQFNDEYRFVGPQLSIKTKPIGMSDDRSCGVYINKRIFHIMSGKIDTIFFSVERILAYIEHMHNSSNAAPSSLIRGEAIQRFGRC